VLDLRERGVHLIPSGLSQLASRSKTLQAALFAPFMLPLTRAIHTQHDLIEAISDYHENSITVVVTKLDRRNAGMGVHLWQSVEDVFSHASLGNIPFPFVLQPFEPDCRDIRIVFLDDYIEAYERYSPHNFRNNLHHGGRSYEKTLCRQMGCSWKDIDGMDIYPACLYRNSVAYVQSSGNVRRQIEDAPMQFSLIQYK